jgi:NAD(P)-dependent dehydrogenase (short-subunit alcohol dehydrogenase family)
VKAYAGWSLYCASKAAMEQFVRAVALEQSVQPNPILAVSINPGVMDTAMQAAVRGSAIDDFPSLERFVRLHAEGRLGRPRDIARRIAAIVASRPEPGGVYSAAT